MSLLLGFLVSLVVEAIKRLKARVGEELGTAVIYGFVFLIAVVWTVLTTNNIISAETINKILTIVATAIATYEIIIKRISGLLEK